MSHISDPPIFSSTCIHTCLYRGFVLVRGGFCSGFVWVLCLEGFVRGGFCPVRPLLSEYIHYNRKLNTTFKFRFHMYEYFKSVTSHALGPPLPPVTNCHTFSDPFPLEPDVLYGLYGLRRETPIQYPCCTRLAPLSS